MLNGQMNSINMTIDRVDDNTHPLPAFEGTVETMATVGDYVVNRQTGHLGTVIGYGHEMVDSVFTPTLKVRVAAAHSDNKKSFIKEDLSFNWTKSN